MGKIDKWENRGGVSYDGEDKHHVLIAIISRVSGIEEEQAAAED